MPGENNFSAPDERGYADVRGKDGNNGMETDDVDV